MSDDLYERDILLWSEKQAGLLRQLSRGERVNEPLDWANLIDEVETVGRSELQAVESFLRLVIVHLHKLRLNPESDTAAHWRGETVNFMSEASGRFAPSMQQRIDLEAIHLLAVRQIRAGIPTGIPVPALPPSCPWTLDELLDPFSNIDALVARLR